MLQPFLFDASPEPPPGFAYQSEFLTIEEESFLVEHFNGLDFRNFRWHEYTGKRRTVTFGWSYSFDRGEIAPADAFLDFLVPVRDRAAHWARIDPSALVQGLITEYQPGAGIGWHRDAPPFGTIVGISLLSDCRFRLRLEDGSEKREWPVERRSIYSLNGPARTVWQHGIPPAKQTRYSITFRTLRQGKIRKSSNR